MKAVKYSVCSVVFIAVLVGAVILGFYIWGECQAWLLRTHQEHIAWELAQIEKEFATIDSFNQAQRAVGLLRYIEEYYVPKPGYRSDAITENNLETQRTQTLQTIIQALEQYSGQQLGENISAWEGWLESQADRLKETPDRP